MKINRLLTGLILLTMPCHGAELKNGGFVRDNIVCLHFDDFVSVDWGKLGGGGHDMTLVTVPLDTDAAVKPGTYIIKGMVPNDAPGSFIPQAVQVSKIGRKTRPHTFARTPPNITKHAEENLIYLVLDQPLLPGASLTVTVPKTLVSSGPTSLTLAYDPTKSRSEAVQVNQLNYLPDAAKYAYVSSWLGDLGAQTFTEGTSFAILDAKTRKPAFTGKLALRKAGNLDDDGYPAVGNYYKANLYECDFGGLTTPGTYVVSVDGVGCSYPFEINADGYRKPYLTMMQGVYHQRCGTALTEPYTKWTHPVCHVESLMQTDHRYMDLAYGDGPPPNADFKTTGEMRKDVWGGYHDAGDWDRESSHPDIGSYLLLAYELTPDHYTDKECNIPESGNGIPDIIDEARWGIDYYRKVQRPDGGVSIGMFESRWPLEGETAWSDTLKKYMYAEEPVATFKQAAAAGHMARILKELGRTDDAKVYEDCALRAWNWASDPKNLRPGDDVKSRDDRFHAAAVLYRLTRDPKYQDSFKKDLMFKQDWDPLIWWEHWDQRLGAWTFALAEDDLPGLDKELREKVRKSTIFFAQTSYVDNGKKRGNRRAYDWYYPFEWGHANGTDNFPLMFAHKLTGEKKFLDAMVANCDMTLGNNPLNISWITGLGAKYPTEVMVPNYWYDPKGPNPGIIPMGPKAYDPKMKADGEWNAGYAWKYVYPPVTQWPPLELWFENRYCAQTNEYVVVHQAILAASFGYLCQPAAPDKTKSAAKPSVAPHTD